jgi:hypothetical protein
VAYLPAGVVSPERAERAITELLQAAPVAKLLLTGAS